MSLKKVGPHWYSDTQAEIREELCRYSRENYLATQFVDAVCGCGHRLFRLRLDDTEGVAIRICTACSTEHFIGDSEDFLEEAEPQECECLCGSEEFELTAGVALYEGTEDVRWLYIGCRCPKCGLTACYGDWKNGYPDYHEFLSRI